VNATALALTELGAIFLGLGVLARLAGRIGMSPIPFYLVGGLAFGHGGLIEMHGMEEFGHVASEIGVVLLLLMLGLEYTGRELVTGLRDSWQAGVLDITLNALPGALVALLLGWGPVGALVMAGVTYISSSGIIAKVLTDLGRLSNRETPAVPGVLVIEDLAMAVYLPLLTAMVVASSMASAGASILVAVSALAVVLVVALRWG